MNKAPAKPIVSDKKTIVKTETKLIAEKPKIISLKTIKQTKSPNLQWINPDFSKPKPKPILQAESVKLVEKRKRKTPDDEIIQFVKKNRIMDMEDMISIPLYEDEPDDLFMDVCDFIKHNKSMIV
jgi:hypothetical protein